MDTLGVWVAAIGTLAMMSFAWRENPFYRAFEHIYIGISAGHATVMGWNNLQSSLIEPLSSGSNYFVVIPLILGLLLYARFFRGYNWVSRYPMAVLVGIGTGLTIRGTIGSQLVQQIQATMLKLNSIDNIIMVVGTVTTLLFFYFTLTRENKVVRVSGTIGKYVMMVAFGASFGNSVMSRMSMMIGRVQFLLGDWLGFLG
jgi:hypothetical protein